MTDPGNERDQEVVRFMTTGKSRKVRASAKQAGNRGLGRVKGVPNKVTGELKDMILQALDGAGGITYLQARALDNPSAFLTLVGKVLPLQVNANVEGEIKGRLVWEWPKT